MSMFVFVSFPIPSSHFLALFYATWEGQKPSFSIPIHEGTIPCMTSKPVSDCLLTEDDVQSASSSLLRQTLPEKPKPVPYWLNFHLSKGRDAQRCLLPALIRAEAEVITLS